MSINPLNDISRIYLEQVAAQEVELDEGMTLKDYKKKKSALKQKEKRAAEKTSPLRRAGIHADKASPERAARHRANVDPDYDYGDEEQMYPGGKLKNPKKIRKAKALGELGESSHLEPDMKKRREANEKAIEDMKKTKAHKDMVAAVRKKFDEALDPVDQEDADIDNDGDSDKSDKYLINRRKAIGKAISKKKVKESNDYDPMDDDDFDHDEAEENRGVSGKNNPKGGKSLTKKKSVKEGFSDWRQDLSEVMDDIENAQKIKEKKVNNKIKVNPKLSEAVEEIGGTLLEMVEIDEFDFIVEDVYVELLGEGYEEDDIEEALEYALIEAKVTFGHDTPSTEKKREGLLSIAKRKLSGAKASAKAAVAGGARKVAKGALGVARKMEGGDKTPKTAERKPSIYRGAGVGQKERVSSGSYTPTTKKKAEPVSDPWEGSYKKSSEVKAKKTKSAAKPKAIAPARKRKSKLDDLLSSVRNEETKINEGELRPGETYMQFAKRKEVEKKDNRMVVSTADKRANTPAYKAYKAGDARYKAGPGVNENAQLDEKTLTKMEMKKREEIVKSMKDKTSDFEKRYPGRGKEVMYATATKMAKRMAESITNEIPLSPQELQKQKQKTMLDTQISQLRKKSLSQIKKPNQMEGNVIDERRREEKGTPREPRDRAFELVSKSMGSSRLGVQPRGKKKEPGKKPPEAGEYGSERESPAQTVTKRRTAAQRAQDMMHSRFD